MTGWKLIAAHLTIHLNGGSFLREGNTLAAKNGPTGPILAAKLGLEEPVLSKFMPKSVWGTTFGGNNFGVTDL